MSDKTDNTNQVQEIWALHIVSEAKKYNVFVDNVSEKENKTKIWYEATVETLIGVFPSQEELEKTLPSIIEKRDFKEEYGDLYLISEAYSFEKPLIPLESKGRQYNLKGECIDGLNSPYYVEYNVMLKKRENNNFTEQFEGDWQKWNGYPHRFSNACRWSMINGLCYDGSDYMQYAWRVVDKNGTVCFEEHPWDIFYEGNMMAQKGRRIVVKEEEEKKWIP